MKELEELKPEEVKMLLDLAEALMWKREARHDSQCRHNAGRPLELRMPEWEAREIFEEQIPALIAMLILARAKVKFYEDRAEQCGSEYHWDWNTEEGNAERWIEQAKQETLGVKDAVKVDSPDPR